MVLAREPLCAECKQGGMVVAASEVDHIIPLADGGTNDPENLQALCKACHSRKTARQMGWGDESLQDESGYRGGQSRAHGRRF